ncbi:MAG: hypothetical protein IJB61_07810 [Bacteroides sp]|nr:hypothetical protein [Bacteroidaceae bacterium]MBQ3191127.1 hypothetical protein [Bacteroides sp.]
MNKKLFLGMFAAAGMLLATSCSNDELDVVQSGNEAQVTFSLAAEGGIATRAISDGTGADLLYYAIFDADGELITTIEGSTAGLLKKENAFPNGSKEDNVSVTLAKGQEYTAVFWAQDASCDAYKVTAETKGLKVAVDYEGDNNDETRDAFFKAETFKVTGNAEIDVELKRPFAQINVGVTKEDWDAAVASGITIAQSSVVIKNAATGLNLLDGTVSGETEVSYSLANIPSDPAILKVDTDGDGVKEEYNWLSMSYILPAEATTGYAKTTMESLQYTFAPVSGNEIVFANGLNSIPVQRNWRTNILGKLLTGDITFNITIDPVYDGDIIYPEASGAAKELIMTATFGGTYTQTEDLSLEGNGLDVKSDFIYNIEDGKTLTSGSASNYGIRVYSGTTTINGGNGKIMSEGGGIGVINGAEVIFNSGNLEINTKRYLFYLEGAGSTLTINDGNFDFNKTQNQKRAYICAMAGTKAYVKGGTFGKASTRSGYSAGILTYDDGEVIITGGTFGFDPTTWVADGYKAVKVGENWIVVANDVAVATTSEEVVTAFENGGNIMLVSDIKLGGRLEVKEGANVNLDMNGKTITLEGTAADPAFYTYKGSTLTITGNGTVEINDPSVSLVFPGGDVVIENGTFVRNVPAGTPANKVGAFFVGAKVSPWGSQTVTINGGYFDGGYYNADAADIDDILAGTKEFTETADDIAKRGNSKDANKVRVAIKQNVQLLLNLSYNLFKIYGGTFVGANPAWGDEGCMLPTTPNYLRPWSYYQGALLDGQEFSENGLAIPDGYEITKGATADGRPTYTVTYNK